jgi:hypothetical protein
MILFANVLNKIFPHMFCKRSPPLKLRRAWLASQRFPRLVSPLNNPAGAGLFVELLESD